MDALETSRNIYDRLVSAAGRPAPSMETWSGERWGTTDSRSTIVLNHEGSLRAMLIPPTDLTAGEAYIHEDVDFQGDLYETLEFGRRLEPIGQSKIRAVRLLRKLRSLPADSRRAQHERPNYKGKLHSKTRDSVAVRSHYDTNQEFFELFLDQNLIYSCAAFLDPTETLETAQVRKLDLICRKLQLTPGQQLLDVGCGWGALVVHAATNYGVTATGTTLSPYQAKASRSRAKEAGVDHLVTIREVDYRETDGTFDAIASVGMFEHVGRNHFDMYFSHLRSLLGPGGLLLNHAIATRDRSNAKHRPSFVNTYVFPDGELVPFEDSVGAAERAGFELRDVESLRRSYALTLRHWVRRLEEHHDEAVEVADETLYRIWRLYMAASAMAFEHAGLNIYQALYADPDRPWTHGRAHLLAKDDS